MKTPVTQWLRPDIGKEYKCSSRDMIHLLFVTGTMSKCSGTVVQLYPKCSCYSYIFFVINQKSEY